MKRDFICNDDERLCLTDRREIEALIKTAIREADKETRTQTDFQHAVEDKLHGKIPVDYRVSGQRVPEQSPSNVILERRIFELRLLEAESAAILAKGREVEQIFITLAQRAHNLRTRDEVVKWYAGKLAGLQALLELKRQIKSWQLRLEALSPKGKEHGGSSAGPAQAVLDAYVAGSDARASADAAGYGPEIREAAFRKVLHDGLSPELALLMARAEILG